MDVYLKVIICVTATFAMIAIAIIAIGLAWMAIEEFVIGNVHTKDKE